MTSCRRTIQTGGHQLTIVAGCLLLFCCARPDRAARNLPLPSTPTGKASMHAVHNEQLRQVMTGLRAASFDRLPQELDEPGRKDARLREVSSLAQNLSQGADRIAGLVDETGLTEQEQTVFLSFSDHLRDRALLLRAQADRGQTRLIRDTMGEINKTCANCHTLFRDMPPAASAVSP